MAGEAAPGRALNLARTVSGRIKVIGSGGEVNAAQSGSRPALSRARLFNA